MTSDLFLIPRYSVMDFIHSLLPPPDSADQWPCIKPLCTSRAVVSSSMPGPLIVAVIWLLLQSISHTASLLQWMDTQGQPDVTCTWNREESLRDVITRPTHTSTAERQAIIFKLSNIHTGMVKLIVPWKMITHMIYCF